MTAPIYTEDLQALRRICEALRRGNFDLVVETENEFSDHWEYGRIPKTFYSIGSQNDRLSFQEIARITMTLIEDRLANWMLSEEGQAVQKKDMASAMFIGAANPLFTAAASRERAESEFRPFDAVIKVLERNGYEVKKK